MTQDPKSILARDWYDPMPCDWLVHAKAMLAAHDARLNQQPTLFNPEPELP